MELLMAAGLGAKVAGSDIHYSVPCNMQYVFVVLWFAVAIFYVMTDQRSSNVLKRWIRIANGVATAQPRSSSPTIEKISNLIKTSGLRERRGGEGHLFTTHSSICGCFFFVLSNLSKPHFCLHILENFEGTALGDASQAL